MGLFDKFKKKGKNDVQDSTPVVIEQPVVTNEVNTNQAVAAEVSVENNPFFEEVAPVEESVTTEPQPSFDNIFNATPSDLIPSIPVDIQESLPTIEETAAVIENPSITPEQSIITVDPSTVFEGGETTYDEITALVSDSVANNGTTETPVVQEPSIELPAIQASPIVENVAPVVEQVVKTPVEVPVTEENVVQAVPKTEEYVENSMPPEAENNDVVVEQPQEEIPVTENSEVMEIVPENPEIVIQPTEEVVLSSENQNTQEYQEETPVYEEPTYEEPEEVYEEGTTEQAIELTSTPATETQEYSEPTIAAVEETNVVEEIPNVEENTVENVEPQYEDNQAIDMSPEIDENPEVAVEENTEYVDEMVSPDEQGIPTIEEAPVYEDVSYEQPVEEVTEEIPVEPAPEENVEYREEAPVEREEIQDITVTEDYLPPEVIQSQLETQEMNEVTEDYSDANQIYELTPAPIEEIEGEENIETEEPNYEEASNSEPVEEVPVTDEVVVISAAPEYTEPVEEGANVEVTETNNETQEVSGETTEDTGESTEAPATGINEEVAEAQVEEPNSTQSLLERTNELILSAALEEEDVESAEEEPAISSEEPIIEAPVEENVETTLQNNEEETTENSDNTEMPGNEEVPIEPAPEEQEETEIPVESNIEEIHPIIEEKIELPIVSEEPVSPIIEEIPSDPIEAMETEQTESSEEKSGMENPKEPENTNEANNYYDEQATSAIYSDTEIPKPVEEAHIDNIVEEKVVEEVEEPKGSEKIRPLIEEDETIILPILTEEVINKYETKEKEEIKEVEEKKVEPIIKPLIEEEDITFGFEQEPAELSLPVIDVDPDSEPKEIQEEEKVQEEPSNIEIEEEKIEGNKEEPEENNITFDFKPFMNFNNIKENNPTSPVKVEAKEEIGTYISEPTTTKFCNNCGIMLTDDSSICPSCGEPID